MKKLEQKDIDNYLLSIQAAFYAAVKKIPSKVRSTLRASGSLVDEKRNASDFGQLLDFTFKQDSDPLSIDSVIEKLSSQFDLTGERESKTGALPLLDCPSASTGQTPWDTHKWHCRKYC
ncbi:hypothetical protein [Escherichia coli]|uniref:hypothetical protein n=1 Tax=Escherichia coli TaxID=562 RepID=UPI002FE59E4B